MDKSSFVSFCTDTYKKEQDQWFMDFKIEGVTNWALVSNKNLINKLEELLHERDKAKTI